VVSSCGESDPPRTGPSDATHPRAADRYTRLIREYLVTKDPASVRQQFSCEVSRLADALGLEEGLRRVHWAEDSVVRSPDASAAFKRADAIAALQSYQVGGALCDSLNAIADREDPIVPAIGVTTRH
jgi:hypothetical protein